MIFNFLFKNHSWLVVQHKRDDNTSFDEKKSLFWPSYAHFQYEMWEKFTKNDLIELFICCYSFQELLKSGNNVDEPQKTVLNANYVLQFYMRMVLFKHVS